jgi:hypothetical protein
MRRFAQRLVSVPSLLFGASAVVSQRKSVSPSGRSNSYSIVTRAFITSPSAVSLETVSGRSAETFIAVNLLADVTSLGIEVSR